MKKTRKKMKLGRKLRLVSCIYDLLSVLGCREGRKGGGGVWGNVGGYKVLGLMHRGLDSFEVAGDTIASGLLQPKVAVQVFP